MRRLVPFLVLVAGCGGMDPAKALSRHRPAAERQLAALQSAGKQAAGLPPLGEARLDRGGPPLRFRHAQSDAPAENAAFIQAEDFADLGKTADAPLRLDDYRSWLEPYWLVKQGTNQAGDQPSAKEIEAVLSRFEQLRYLLVLRTRTYNPPALGPEEDIDPGLYQGDLLVFDLTTGRMIGGTRIVVDSSTWVPALLPPGADPAAIHARALAALRDDLRSRARKVVHDFIAAQAPGSDAPGFGY